MLYRIIRPYSAFSICKPSAADSRFTARDDAGRGEGAHGTNCQFVVRPAPSGYRESGVVPGILQSRPAHSGFQSVSLEPGRAA